MILVTMTMMTKKRTTGRRQAKAHSATFNAGQPEQAKQKDIRFVLALPSHSAVQGIQEGSCSLRSILTHSFRLRDFQSALVASAVAAALVVDRLVPQS